MSKVHQKRIKATILYATETGKSETFAQKLAKLMNMSFFVQVQCMEDYDFEKLFDETYVIFVTSTFGNGEAPDNGKVCHDSFLLTHKFMFLCTVGILETAAQFEQK